MFRRKKAQKRSRTSKKLSLEKCEERRLLTTTTCVGDVNGDYAVGFDDFLDMSASYGQAVDPAGTGADLDGNGNVGFGDFLILSENFGTICEPDLAITSLEVTDATPDSITYEFEISNVGDAPANLDGPTGAQHDNVSVQAFFSSDTHFNNVGDTPAGGAILGLSPVGELLPGETFTQTRTISIPFDAASQPYLTIMADWGGVVAESNEGNNTAATKIMHNEILDVTFNTESPAEVPNGTNVNVSFTYMTDQTEGVRIWARPMSGGELAPDYAAHGSPLHVDPFGEGEGYFTIPSGEIDIDQVRLQMWNSDSTELLTEKFVDVDYEFVNPNNIFDVSFETPSPADLDHDDRVDLSFSYTTDETDGVYIWARPMSNGELTPNYGAHASPLHLDANGDGTGFFTVSSGYAQVDQVRLQMWNSDKTEMLDEVFADVDFEFGERFVLVPIDPIRPIEPVIPIDPIVPIKPLQPIDPLPPVFPGLPRL